MKFFKKADVKIPAEKPEPKKIRALTAIELVVVSGGLNPQPLPPCAIRW